MDWLVDARWRTVCYHVSFLQNFYHNKNADTDYQRHQQLFAWLIEHIHIFYLTH